MAKIKGKISPKMKKALKDAHDEARERTIQRASVHFRLTERAMSNLLKVADKCQKPYGTMCREWIEHHLDLEAPTPDGEVSIFKSIGKTMVCALHPDSKKAQTILTPYDVTMAADCGCVFRRGIKATAWLRMVVGEGLQKPYASAG